METSITFRGPLKWSDAIRAELAKSFACDVGAKAVEDGVKANTRQAWHVFDGSERIGTIVTEVVDQDTYRELFVWCYQGRSIRRVLPALALRAYHSRVSAVGFFTPHYKAVWFGFKEFAPLVEDFGPPGEKRFTFNSETLAHGKAEKRS